MLFPTIKSLVSSKTPGYADKTEKRVYFRSGFTPYIAAFETVDDPLPITKIIVGPHLDKTIRQEKLERYLEISRLEIEVVCSETPLI